MSIINGLREVIEKNDLHIKSEYKDFFLYIIFLKCYDNKKFVLNRKVFQSSFSVTIISFTGSLIIFFSFPLTFH